MSKQERRAKAGKAAKAKAEAVVSEAIAEAFPNSAAVEASDAAVVGKPKRGGLPAEHLAMAPQVKELREQGVAWWQIGFKLGLPGGADTVAKGKGGAAYARKIWKAAFGEVPRVQVRDGSRSKKAEKNENVRTLRETSKAERVLAVRAGQSVINPDMTDEEVLAMLDGRMITWSINLANVDGQADDFYDNTIGVFRGTLKVHGLGVDRMASFREYDPSAPIKERGTPGGLRTVRVSAIHTIGKSQP